MNCIFLQYYCFYSILINLFHKYIKKYCIHFINLQRMCSTFSFFLFYYVPLFCSYNLESSTWDVIPINGGPLQRYGHSLALHKVNTLLIIIPCIIMPPWGIWLFAITIQSLWFTFEKMWPQSLSIMLQGQIVFSCMLHRVAYTFIIL